MGKSNTATNIFVEFCNNKIRSGYTLWWGIGSNVIKLYKGGTLATSSVISTTGFIKVIIKRTTSGVFTVILNNTIKMTATDNTFTSSTHFNLLSTSQFGASIANLKITQGVTV